MRDDAHDLCDAGWAALSERRWTDARRLFEQAVARDAAAAALEGLGWAAWWLDDADATFAARERAYRRLRDDGDDAGAARVAIWLAGDHADFRGELSAARGWLGRARRLLDGCAPCAEHGWLAFYEAYFAAGEGDPAAARELARSAVQIGRRLGEPDVEMLGRALEGSALVAVARVGEGMRCLDEAAGSALAGEARLPIAAGWTCCFLIAACERVGDLERAREWCDRVAEFARRHESAYLLGICRTHYAAVHVHRGEWERAEAELVAAVADFERSRPPYAGDAIAWLAELRRRQGRLEEALELTERVPGHRRAMLTRAALALDRGDPREAAELAERLLRTCPVDARMSRAAAVELLVAARAQRGQPDAARVALGELQETARLVGTAPLRASAAHAAGVLAAADGDHEHARVLFEDAVDVLVACGSPYEAARARLALAATFLALGREEDAAREAAAGRRALAGLGAREPRPAAGRGPPGGAAVTAGLTRRETEVLRLVADGLTNAQIAERLVVSPHTVHRHVANVLRKLGLPTRAAAAAQAARSGLLE
ncbi:MAG TPA: LuxR C-terminal-related transcriptional regulator [Solirubrobacteraceae bacterium]|nr:LuxR C-terminal-related transcriptional regulator [Solirubrobacteraceae bacterium]